MLKNHLNAIKGELMHYFFEVYSSMNTDQLEDGKTKTNYDEFWDEAKGCFRDLMEIHSITDLDEFCESWGLNDMDNQFELSFYNLAKKYLEVRFPENKK